MALFQQLKAEIEVIQAIDNHSHLAWPYHGGFEAWVISVVKYLLERSSTRLQFGSGALLPLRDAEYIDVLSVIKDLYGFEAESITKNNAEDLVARILGSREAGLAAAYNTALDKAGVEIALVDTPLLPLELDQKRFRWVPRVDQFLYPLTRANTCLRERAGESFERFERELTNVYQVHGEIPETWEDYLALIEKELNRYKTRGAVAVKIWSAFFRSLKFVKIPEKKAKNIFVKYAKKGDVKEAEYKHLQDFLAHHIISLCIDLDLAVHIHTGFGLANQLITLESSSPLNLENLAGDEELGKLKLVLIHGGYPFYREAASLARMKDNVFLDFSWLSVLLPPKDLSYILREWIAWKLEDRVLFGTDADSTPWATDDLVCVYGTRRARNALTLALSSMIEDSSLSENEATIAAQRMLRENALTLYSL